MALKRRRIEAVSEELADVLLIGSNGGRETMGVDFDVVVHTKRVEGVVEGGQRGVEAQRGEVTLHIRPFDVFLKPIATCLAQQSNTKQMIVPQGVVGGDGIVLLLRSNAISAGDTLWVRKARQIDAIVSAESVEARVKFSRHQGKERLWANAAHK